MATDRDNGLRFSDNVIEADNMYQILLTLLQGALWYIHQVQSRKDNGEILIDKSDRLTGIWQSNHNSFLYLKQAFNLNFITEFVNLEK